MLIFARYVDLFEIVLYSCALHLHVFRCVGVYYVKQRNKDSLFCRAYNCAQPPYAWGHFCIYRHVRAFLFFTVEGEILF